MCSSEFVNVDAISLNKVTIEKVEMFLTMLVNQKLRQEDSKKV